MIPADLLDRLREADHVLWDRFFESKIGEYYYTNHDGCDEYGDIYEYQLENPVREAWLQACIQEAIRARGWGHEVKKLISIGGYGGHCVSVIYQLGNKLESTKATGDTEAEALLRAFLVAIEAAA